jgi:hypothetical protein
MLPHNVLGGNAPRRSVSRGEQEPARDVDAYRRPSSNEKNHDRTAASQLGAPAARLRLNDFNLMKTLGTGKSRIAVSARTGLTEPVAGTFARVWLSRLAHPAADNPDGQKVYALKVLRKVDSKPSSDHGRPRLER